MSASYYNYNVDLILTQSRKPKDMHERRELNCLPEKDTEKLHINTDFDFEYENVAYNLRIYDIADNRGISTKIMDEKIWLDWHNVLENPDQARLHMFLAADKNVDFEEKLKRMITFSKSIEVYDSIMSVNSTTFSPNELTDLIKICKLPRPSTVTLDTATFGLRQLFTNLGFHTDNNNGQVMKPFVVSWDELVRTSKSGELIGTWLEQKGKTQTIF
jgi:hypothetical protein